MKRNSLVKRVLSLGLAGVMILSAGCSKKPSAPTESAPQTEAATEAAKAEETTASEEETSAAEESKEYISAPEISKENFPVMDGSTATLPLGRMIYSMCTGASEKEAEDAITFTKTTNSYMRLMDGDAEILISYEAGEAAKERPEYEDLQIEPIGLDALIFLCNVENPVESLTTKQIQDIYTGKIHNWTEVGAKNFDKEIVAFQRPDNSGSQTLMKNLMMKGLEMAYAPEEYKPGEMGDLVEAVANYNNKANALGYSVYYYANNMYMIPGLRFMAVDGVAPENDSIRSGEYKYVNPFYAAIRKDCDKDSEAYKLFTWLTGDDGQSLINALGYVACSDADKEIPEEFAPKYAEVDTGLRRFVIRSENFDGGSGIVVFGSDMHPKKSYPEVTINSDFELSYGDVIIAQTYKPIDPAEPKKEEWYGMYEGSEEYGLFNIETGKWIVEPKYDYAATPWVTKDEDIASLTFLLGSYDPDSADETIDCYDIKGNPVDMDIDYENIPYGIESYEDYQNKYYTTEYYENADGISASSYRMGKDGKYEVVWDEESIGHLYLHGKEVELYKNNHVFPYMGVISREDQYPMGWTYTGSYDMDEEYNLIAQKDILINEDSDIVLTITNQETRLVMATEKYYITQEYDRYVIRNYDGDMIFNWVYSTYNPDYDWNYDN